MSALSTSAPTARDLPWSLPVDRVREGARPRPGPNVGKWERVASAAVGAALVGVAVKRPSPLSLLGAAAGAALVWRGFSGQCAVYRALGVNTDEGAGTKGFHGVMSRAKVTIAGKSPDELYRIWRDFSSQPKFSKYVESVETLPDGRTRWTLKGPVGGTLSWDAEVITDVPGQVIGWQSVEHAEVDNAGAVRFAPAPGGRGTEVELSWSLQPPLGPIGKPIVELFNWLPQHRIDEDLRRFKQWVEAGEIATTDGQPAARGDGRDHS